jgi:hypothetical protein
MAQQDGPRVEQWVSKADPDLLHLFAARDHRPLDLERVLAVIRVRCRLGGADALCDFCQ